MEREVLGGDSKDEDFNSVQDYDSEEPMEGGELGEV